MLFPTTRITPIPRLRGTALTYALHQKPVQPLQPLHIQRIVHQDDPPDLGDQPAAVPQNLGLYQEGFRQRVFLEILKGGQNQKRPDSSRAAWEEI